MITHTTLSIEINGKLMPGCLSLHLSQAIHGHHHFRVTFAGRAVEKDPMSLAADSLQLAGSEIKIELGNTRGEASIFKGIVTAVHSLGANQAGYSQNVVFEGYSPTILLENGPSCQAFSAMTLKDIISKLSQGAAQNLLTTSAKPLFASSIAYTVQYQESAFACIDRLARRWGEWCYYDGLELVVGQKQPQLSLTYGYNLLQFDFNMQTAPAQGAFTAWGYKAAEHLQGQTKKSDSTIGDTAAFALESSHKSWQPPQPVFLHQFSEEEALKQQLDTVAKLQLQAAAARKLSFRGASSQPGLHPGAHIAVKSAGATGQELGQYIITAVEHSFQEGGRYSNTFEAVPYDVEVSPLTQPTLVPQAGAQPGTVADNNDPQGLGRVKVKLFWQQDTTTPWIRIATPHGGADKGMFFVPEIEEEVMVGFEEGNAEKPFVIGSLYHGKAAAGSFKNDKNDIKAIRTRSGHTIELNDAEGAEYITITDKNNNSIKINTSTNDIVISSLENLKLSAKNIQLDATENITMGAGKNMNCSIGETYNIMAKDAHEHVENEKTSSSKKAEITSEEVAINSTSKNLVLASQKSVDIQSNEKVKLF